MTENQTNAGGIIVMLCLISSVGRYVLDSYLPSLPAMAHYFSISSDNVQLTISYYLLGFSLSQLIYGPLSDSFGRKRTLILGLSIFTSGSLICTFLHKGDFSLLLLFRFLTGLGAGSCGVLNRAIASDCFKGEHFSKAWSYTTTALVLTLILAPLLGGYVQEYYSWQANFAVATFYVAIILFVVIRFLPETHAAEKRSQWNTRVIFKNYYHILLKRSFLVPTFCYTCAFAGLIAYFQASPLLFIGQFGLTPLQYGCTSIVIAICYLVGGLLVNRLVMSLGPKVMLQLGLLILTLAGLSLLLVGEFNPRSIVAILSSISLYVIGARIVIANAIAEAFAEVRHQGGTASALIGTIQMLGATIMSVAIAQFQQPSALILGFCLTLLGFLSLLLYFFFGERPATSPEAEVI